MSRHDEVTPTYSYHNGDLSERVLDHDSQLVRLTEQLSIAVLTVNEIRMDVKLIMADSERRRERDAVYDRWLRAIPITLAVISGAYWLLIHLQK